MDIFFQPSIHPNLPLMKPFMCIAHRGNSNEAPENTSQAFQQAIDLSSDYLEVDVHLTKDGVPVIFHDLYFSRIIPNAGDQSIASLNYAEIQLFDVGAWFGQEYSGEKILSLAEAMDKFADKIGFMIEIKAGSASPQKLAQAVMDIISKHAAHSKIYVGSLSAEIGKVLREKNPSQPLIAIIEEEKEFVLHEKYHPEMIAVSYDLLNQRRLRQLKQAGKIIWAWTVDDPIMMYQLIQMRVDGIITNCPRELKKVIQNQY